jgi:hypothetical protein
LLPNVANTLAHGGREIPSVELARTTPQHGQIGDID